MGLSWKSFIGILDLIGGNTSSPEAKFAVNQVVKPPAKPTPSQVVTTLQATVDKLKGKKKTLEKTRTETADAIAKYKACQKKCEAGTYGGTCNGVGMTCEGIVSNKAVLETELIRINVEIAKVQKQLDDANAKLAAAKKAAGMTTTTTNSTTTNSSAATTQVLTSNWSGKWKYNAPLVKHAYFRQSLQSNLLDGMYVDQGNYSDALDAWKFGMGGRGTIQQDRKWIRNVLAQKGQSAKIIKNVSHPWGFKFLYNPTAVSMAWGIQSVADPLFLANTTQLAIQPVTMNLSSAVVDFNLIINRLEDHTYLLGDGSIAGYTKTPSSDWNQLDELDVRGEVVLLKQDIERWKREKLEYDRDQNPYPVFVPIEDRKMIVERGTMYDIEYLFRTLMSPLEPFEGALNGVTSDRAYLQPAIVELHLGDAMRYRVRVEKFSVNHIVFSPKMVPLFSTVTMSVSRFVDSPETNQTNSNDFKPVTGIKNLDGSAVKP